MTYYLKPIHNPALPRKLVPVKNLRWLVEKTRKWIVTEIVCLKGKDDNGRETGILTAFFDNGYIFKSDFASYDVMMNYFLKKRTFHGIKITEFNMEAK